MIIKLCQHRPALRIDSDGIIDNVSVAAAGRISWIDIKGVYLHTIHRQRMIAVQVWDASELAKQTGPVTRIMMRMNTSLGFEATYISESALPCQLEAVLDAMLRHNPDLEICW